MSSTSESSCSSSEDESQPPSSISSTIENISSTIDNINIINKIINKKRRKSTDSPTPVVRQKPVITIFENGKQFDGKVIFIPSSMEELFEIAKTKLAIQGIVAYTSEGMVITDVASIKPKSVVFIATESGFRRPVCNQEQHLCKDGTHADWMSLNVGGRTFSTTKSTICKFENNMLAQLVGHNWESLKDGTGAFLIDRSPEYFAPILNYLRTAQLIIDDGTNPVGVLEEARFYGIPGIQEILEQRGIHLGESETDAFSRRDIVNLLLTSSQFHLRSQGIDLSHVDLSKLDLSDINFQMSNFSEANLSGANLQGAQLQSVDLSGADLSYAKLSGANLKNATLDNAILKGADLEDRGLHQKTNLNGASLVNANLEDCNLSAANLRSTNFRGANLVNCNLRNADLAGANLEGANLRGATLWDTNMRGANLTGVEYDLRTIRQ